MIKFIFQRLGYGFLVILGVVMVVFLLFFTVPGDPVSMMVDQQADKTIRDAIRKDLGLDKPLHTQLYMYMRDLSPFSVHPDTPKEKEKYGFARLIPLGESVFVLKYPYLGRSFQTNQKVSDIVGQRVSLTIILALAAMFFATVVGITLGIFAALKQNTFWDGFISVVSVFGISTPSFVAASIISLVFGYMIGPYIGLNGIGTLWEIDPISGDKILHLKNLILPALTLGIRPLAIIVQLTRSSMLEVLSQDYIRTARAKGLSNYKVIVKHALKNALNPVVSTISNWLASLLAGAFFIETIFDYKGLGFETIQALDRRDLPIIMGATLVVAVVFVLINLVADLLYAVIDPRIRLN